MVSYSNWWNQRWIGGDRQIRVGFVMPQDSELRRAQIVGLRALVEELNTLTADPSGRASLPIKLAGGRDQIPIAANLLRLIQSSSARG